MCILLLWWFFLIVVVEPHRMQSIDAGYFYRPLVYLCVRVGDDCKQWVVQKRLNRSRCSLGCGLRWAEDISHVSVLSQAQTFLTYLGLSLSLYPPSEGSATGGYTIFTFVCLSVCLCALSPAFNSVATTTTTVSAKFNSSLGGYMHSLSAF